MILTKHLVTGCQHQKCQNIQYLPLKLPFSSLLQLCVPLLLHHYPNQYGQTRLLSTNFEKKIMRFPAYHLDEWVSSCVQQSFCDAQVSLLTTASICKSTTLEYFLRQSKLSTWWAARCSGVAPPLVMAFTSAPSWFRDKDVFPS